MFNIPQITLGAVDERGDMLAMVARVTLFY
jgi:hypothetical protein